MSIYEKAVLVRLTMRSWAGKKQDKKLVQTVVDAHHMARDSVNTTKYLIAQNALKPIRSVLTDLYQYHKSMTVPWTHRSVAVLPVEKLPEYIQEVKKYKDAFEKRVEDFLTHYEIYKSDSQQRLGDRYDPTEFPTSEQLRRKFSIDVDILPIPKSDHFLVNITEHVDKTKLDEKVQKMAEQSTKFVWKEIKQRLEQLHRPFTDPKGRVFKSHFVMLDKLVDKLRSFNMDVDPDVEFFAQYVETKITSADQEALKTEAYREEIKHNIEQALKLVESKVSSDEEDEFEEYDEEA